MAGLISAGCRSDEKSRRSGPGPAPPRPGLLQFIAPEVDLRSVRGSLPTLSADPAYVGIAAHIAPAGWVDS